MVFSRPNDFDAEAELPSASSPVSMNVHSPENVPGAPNAVPYQSDSLEFSAPLETLVPLEAPRQLSRIPLNQTVAVPSAHQAKPQPVNPQPVHQPPAIQQPATQPFATESSGSQEPLALERSGLNSALSSATPVEIQSEIPARSNDEIIIPLLEERLVIDRHRRKVGEVVVRKEIETHIVEVPIRREKLIVEQITPTYKQLAVVDLEPAQIQQDHSLGGSLSQTASAKFTSANAAIEFIEAIAADSNSTLTGVQVSIVLVDENLQTAYQQWLAQHPN